MKRLFIIRPTYRRDWSVAASSLLAVEGVEVTSSSSTLHFVAIPSSAKSKSQPTWQAPIRPVRKIEKSGPLYYPEFIC